MSHVFLSLAVAAAGFDSVDGGAPLTVDDNIYLCGRTARNNSRGFDGQLSELLIFDTSLTAEQIEGLYLIETVSFDPVTPLARLLSLLMRLLCPTSGALTYTVPRHSKDRTVFL